MNVNIKTMNQTYKTLLIDGSFLAHQSYAVLRMLKNKSGLRTGMIYGFLNTLNALVKEYKPYTIVVFWECYEQCFRKSIYSEYKKGRKRPESGFITQTMLLMKLLDLYGIDQYTSKHAEADDLIANYVTGEDVNKPVLIFSGDKDILQLVREDVHVLARKKINKKTVNVLYDSKKVKDEYGIEPYDLDMLFAIVGDSVDNISGIPKYGYKKTMKLLNTIGTLDDITWGREEWDIFYRNMQLITLPSVMYTKDDVERPNITNIEGDEQSIFEELGFKKFLENPDYLKPLKTFKSNVNKMWS